jgi:DNA-binding NarL/FixJ family response regulator
MNKLFFFIAVFLCTALPAQAQNHEFDSIAKLMDERIFSHNAEAEQLMEQLYEIAYRNPDSAYLITHCFCKEAHWRAAHGKSDMGLIKKIEKRYNFLNNTGSSLETAMLVYALGVCEYAQGNYSIAFLKGLQALEDFILLNDSIFISKSLQSLGAICLNINRPELSANYYSEASNWTSKQQVDYYKIQINILLSHAIKGDMGTLIHSLQQLLDSSKGEIKNDLLITIYMTLATAHNRNNNLYEAEQYFNKVHDLLEEIDNDYIKASFYNNFGFFMLKKQEFQKALDYFNITRLLCEQDANATRLYQPYSGLASTFEQLGQKDSAYFYMKKKDEIAQLIFAGNRAIEVYQQYIQASLQSTEDKLVISEQKVQLKNRQLWLIIAVSVIELLFALSLLLFINRQKLKKTAENRELHAHREQESAQEREREKERERKKEEERAIREREKEQTFLSEQKRQKEIIDAKNRELASTSLIQANTADFMQKILKLTSQIRKNEGDPKQLIKKIDNIVYLNFNVQKEWKNFKIKFEQVHPDFFINLKKRCPELTEDNLKVCAYIKVGLDGKEIAQMLNITHGSLVNNRYRLKKKLGLSEEQSLEDFLKRV